VGRGNDHPLAGALGRGAFDRRDRQAARRVKKRGGWQGASARFAGEAITDQAGWIWAQFAAPIDATPHRRANPAAALQRRDGCDTWPGDGSESSAAGAQAGSHCAPARPYRCATALWPRGHLLLADRRARHEEFSILRRRIRAWETLLRGPRKARLRQAAGSPRGRSLRTMLRLVAGGCYSLAATRIARGVAAMSWSCEVGRSERMKPYVG
jgi:hypothetical protein